MSIHLSYSKAYTNHSNHTYSIIFKILISYKTKNHPSHREMVFPLQRNFILVLGHPTGKWFVHLALALIFAPLSWLPNFAFFFAIH